MAGVEAIDEAMMIAFGIERRGSAFAGHRPVVVRALPDQSGRMSFLGNVREDPERLLLACLDQLHLGMIFPGAEREFRLLRRIVVLLRHQSRGIGNDAPKPIGPKPSHRERRRAAGTAPHDRTSPRIIRQGEERISFLDLGDY